ncbi:MAG: iron-sulfur cluster assembly scaffold protein [Patescibacteria group bacterium]|nr:iron-sulfur cluster assembly scaffold protein [Patescibacteria group bacterium]
MLYSKKVIKHFKNPHNCGVIKDADAVGKVKNQVCGDVLKIYLKINKSSSASSFADSRRPKPMASDEASEDKKAMEGNAIIKDIKFETLGCVAAVATSSVLSDMIKGKSIDDALKITKEQIIKELGGLPAPKVHCSMLGIDALRKAIENYLSHNA